MYTIIEQKGAAEVGSVSKLMVFILADTASDIPTVKDAWAVGSICMIAETHKYKVLNSEREWV